MNFSFVKKSCLRMIRLQELKITNTPIQTIRGHDYLINCEIGALTLCHTKPCFTMPYHIIPCHIIIFLFSKPYHRWIMLFFRFLKSEHAIEIYNFSRNWLLGGKNRYTFPYAIRETRRCTVSNTQVKVKACGVYDTLYSIRIFACTCHCETLHSK